VPGRALPYHRLSRPDIAYEDGAEETIAVSALIDIEALREARKQDTGTANPLLRARLGNVPAVLRDGVVLPAQQLPLCADVGRGVRQAGDCRILAEHGEGRVIVDEHVVQKQRRSRRSQMISAAENELLTRVGATRRWASSCGSSGSRPAFPRSFSPTAPQMRLMLLGERS